MPRRTPSPLDQLIGILEDVAYQFADRMADHVERMTGHPAQGIPAGERAQHTTPKVKRSARQSQGPYEVLGVSPSADQEVIKAAYKALAGKHHPDRGGSAKKMQEINQAWEAIKKERGL